MKKSWSFNAMFILVLWLPATMHCGIEKVGVVADAFDCQSRAAESGTDGSHCADDVCDLVENGWIRAEILDTIVSVSPALLLEPVRFSDVFQTSPAIAEGSRVKVAREAEDWSVFWRFAARVTPPVRAPAGPV